MKEYTVGDCFYQIRNGANIKQGDVAGGYPITRIETTANDTFNRDRMGYAGITDLSKYKSYVLEDGDLLMSHINSVQYLGRTVLYEKQEDEAIIHGMNLLSLKANRNIILPEFACYSFLSVPFKKQLSKITKKSVNQASFTVADLKKITLSVPSFREQKEIVQNLDKCRSIKAKRRQQLSALDDLIKARFVEMFGNPEVNSKGWEKAQLKDHAEVSVGYPFPSEGYSEEGVDIVGGYNLMQGYIQWNNSKHWPNETGYEQYLLHENDIVIAMDRPWVNGGFKIARIDAAHLPALLIQRTACIRGKEVLQEFLYVLLNSQRFAKHCNVTGSLVPHISNKDINSFQVILPPIELQNEFATFVKQVDKSKAAVQKSLDETQLLFDSLMQEYFG